jgi:transcriptional regulator with GAF, ATPase, and Fis domain
VTDLDARPCGDPYPESVGDVAAAELPESLTVLRELTRLLLDAETVDAVLRRVVTTARYAIPGADLVSITLLHDDGTLETPTGTASEAVELDQAQYRARNGPCVDAADPDGPAYALSNDLAGETRWPAFAASATAHGYGSVLSSALLTGDEPLPFTGALNVYSVRRVAFDDSARDIAFVLAAHASLALALASTRETLARKESAAANLRQALAGRTVIGQATGILMARRGLTAEEAFGVLSRTSQNNNIKLSRLAALLASEPDIAEHL